MSAELQNSLIEKSIRAGCRAVYTQSTSLPHQVVSTYELLSDLSATEEVDLSQFTLGHCCAIPSVENMAKEMEEIRAALGKRRQLDFLTVSVNRDCDTKILEEVMTTSSDDEEMSLGFHFPTSILQGSADVDIDQLLLKLSDVRTGRNIPSPTFSIAMNYLTFHNASKVAAWARKQDGNGTIIASEILRIHDRRPSLLSPPIQKGAAAATGLPSRDSKAAMLDAIENLKVSFDRCIHMEMQYIERLSSTSMPDGGSRNAVNIHDLCVGHALMQSQANILSTEEWKYLLHSQIEPRWMGAMDSVRSASKESAEWASLYSSLAKHLFASFSEMQDTRKFLLLEDVLTGALKENGDGLTIEEIERKGSDVPAFLASVSKNFIDADMAMLSGVEVPAESEGEAPFLFEQGKKVEPKSLFKNIEASCSAYV